MFTREHYKGFDIVTDELLLSGGQYYVTTQGGYFWDWFMTDDAAKIAIDGAIESANIALDFCVSVKDAIEESLTVDGYAINDDVIATLAIQAISEYNQPIPSDEVA